MSLSFLQPPDPSYINQPLEVSFISEAIANKVFTTNGKEVSKGTRQTDRIVFKNMKAEEQGNYAFAVESSFSTTKPTPFFLKTKSFVFLRVKIEDGTENGKTGYVKVNSESLRKRLGLDKKSFEKEVISLDHDLTSLINKNIIQNNEIKLAMNDLAQLKPEAQFASQINEKYKFFDDTKMQYSGFRADRVAVLKGLIKCLELLKILKEPLSAAQDGELHSCQMELEQMHDAETLYKKGVRIITEENNVSPLALEALNQAVDAGSIGALDELEKRRIIYKGELSSAQITHLADKHMERANLIEKVFDSYAKSLTNMSKEKNDENKRDYENEEIRYRKVFGTEFNLSEARNDLGSYYKNAFSLYLKAAEKGDAAAMLKVADFYAGSYSPYPFSDIVSKDWNKAIDFYLRGAKKVFENQSPSQVDITTARNGYYKAVMGICIKDKKHDNNKDKSYLGNYKISKKNGKALLEVGEQLLKRGLTESESGAKVNRTGCDVNLALGIGHFALGQYTEAFSMLTNLMELALQNAEAQMLSYDEALAIDRIGLSGQKNPGIEISKKNSWNSAVGHLRLATRALDEMRKVCKECKNKNISLEKVELAKAEKQVDLFKKFLEEKLKQHFGRFEELNDIRLHSDHNNEHLVSLSFMVGILIGRSREEAFGDSFF